MLVKSLLCARPSSGDARVKRILVFRSLMHLVPYVTPDKWLVMGGVGRAQGHPEDQTKNLVACCQVPKTNAVSEFKGQMLLRTDTKAKMCEAPGSSRLACSYMHLCLDQPGGKAQVQGGEGGRRKARPQVTFTSGRWQALAESHNDCFKHGCQECDGAMFPVAFYFTSWETLRETVWGRGPSRA